MARGKLKIQQIQNLTNRQITFSKRKNGLFKKANELSILCDAKVLIITSSSTERLHSYVSPNITLMEILDMYEHTKRVDLWNPSYQRKLETLRNLQEENKNLQKQIRQKTQGESLNELEDFKELCFLKQQMKNTTKLCHERKLKVIASQIETTKKKCRGKEAILRQLRHELEGVAEDPHYRLVETEGGYQPVTGYQIEGSSSFSIGLQPNHHNLYVEPSLISQPSTSLDPCILIGSDFLDFDELSLG